MPGAHEGRAHGPDNARRRVTTGYVDYAAARERYFEVLRVDAEVRRLERSWQLPTAGGPAEAGEPDRRG